MEGGGAGEPDLADDRPDGEVGLAEESGSGLDFEVKDILCGGNAEKLFPFAVDNGPGKPVDRSQGVQIHGLGIIRLQPDRDISDFILVALLEPAGAKDAERTLDGTTRLALQEAAKALPWGLVWNEWCERRGVPSDFEFMNEIRTYEKQVLSSRD